MKQVLFTQCTHSTNQCPRPRVWSRADSN